MKYHYFGFPALLLLPLLSACTVQAWYEGMRASARQQCGQLAPGAYEDCMNNVNSQSYDSYEQERQRLRKDGNKDE